MIMFGKSKLRRALLRGDMNGIRDLLDRGVDPNGVSDNDTMLWYAVTRGNRGAVKMLLDKGAVVTEEMSYNKTLLHNAAQKGSVEIAAMLLEKCPALLAMRDSDGNTALHLAAHAGYPDFVEDMIARGLDPKDKNFNNRTAYALASQKNQREVMELLRPQQPAQAVAAPEAAPAEEEFTEEETVEETGEDISWKKLPGERIARIAAEDAIGYRVTEIFNFSAREKTTLYRNMESDAETVETRRFEEMGDRAALEEALAELQKRGGRSGISSISSIDKKRLGATP